MPLLVCATPIGNLEDVTLRVLAALRDADVVLCEDTRRTRILLARHDIHRRALVSLHRHNEARRVDELLPRLREGAVVALASDAGLPGIADPGTRVVAAALAAGLEVTVLPGASAVDTALVASRFAGDGPYRFAGWLPRREAERQALWGALAAVTEPVVAFESPRRLPTSLRSLAAIAPARRLCVCRELTKVHEEVVRGTAAELSARFAAPPRGEVTVVLAPGLGRTGSAAVEDARAAVRELAAAGAPLGVAARVVARLTSVPRNDLYESGL